MSEHGDGTELVSASPAEGYDVCYSVQPWQPVSLFTARQGLELTMGDAKGDNNKHRGTLVRPVEVRADGVVWLLHVREPGQTEARQVRFLVGPRTAKPLLPEGVDYDPKLWASPEWVSRDGGTEGMQL